MGCRKCAEKRRARAALAAAAADAKKSEAARTAAQKEFELASEWHQWGWKFIHRFTMAVPPDVLPPPALEHIRRVVQLFIEGLPCKDCQGHAAEFLSGGPTPRLGRVTTGRSLVALMHELHNDVNRRTTKPQPDMNVLLQYKSINLRQALDGYMTAVRREPVVPTAALDALDAHLKALGL